MDGIIGIGLDGAKGSGDRPGVAAVPAVPAFPSGALLVPGVAEEGVELGPDHGADGDYVSLTRIDAARRGTTGASQNELYTGI